MSGTHEERLAKAKNYAYRLLAYRARSSQELAERLKRKKFSKKIVERIINNLEELNYLNDKEFSRTFVEIRFSSNPCGRKLIEQELKKKGINEEIIRDTCEAVFDGNREYELASNLALRRLPRYKDLDEKAKWHRLYGLLGRRGFQLEVVQDVLEQVLGKQV